MDSQRSHEGFREDSHSQRPRRGLTEDAQRTHRGFTEDSQRIRGGLVEDTHKGFAKVLQRTCPQRVCKTQILARFFLHGMHHTWV